MFSLIFLIILTLTAPINSRKMEVKANSYDTVFRNCTLIDGSGSPVTIGDLAVTGDQISGLGTINETLVTPDTVIIEGDQNYLTPGFIDSHTHDDVAVLATPQHTAKTLQGVTTVVTGNCGFSNYPNGQENELVRQHLSLLLGDVKSEHFFQNFTLFAQSLQTNGIGINVASLVGHGPLRISIMGAETHGEANQTQIEEMCQLLDTQFNQGAIGLSLGLVYPPSAFAGQLELVSLAKVVQKHNKVLTAHVRSYEGNLLSSIAEFLEILRQSGAKGLLSHLQVAGRPYWGTMMDEAIAMIEKARDEGIDINVDMYPYLAGSSTILQLLPPSSQLLGFEAFLEHLEDPEYLLELKNMTEFGSEEGWESKISLIGWENVVVGSVVKQELKFLEGLNMTQGGQLMSMTEFEFLIYLVIQDQGQTNVIMHQQSQGDQNKVFQFYSQMIGSDSIPREGGKPHPRGYGSFPRVIGRMVRNDGILMIQDAVRKGTGLTASRFSIGDRGLLKLGFKADLVLFNEQLLDLNTFEEPTLKPQGILGVWVNGVKVVENGQEIFVLPGQVVQSQSINLHDEL